MLRSLFSGVSGLQSHQIALDVESNNIANVNTVGYKYSRANFSDLLAQTSKIATAPQGQLGGKNALQVGLGTNVDSVTRIFSQGSLQNSDKNTDVAIQGDGFFTVSADGGSTYKYTRSGDFKFDADGNFVDNNGFKVQGWLRDEVTGKVDSSAPITSIQIPPGLTTPAEATEDVVVKANLNSGSTVKSYGAIRSLDPFHEAADLNRDGILNNKDSLTVGQATSTSGKYVNAPWNFNSSASDEPTDRIYESTRPLDHIFIDPNTGYVMERGENFSALVDTEGRAFNLQSGTVEDVGQGVWVGFENASVNSQTITDIVDPGTRTYNFQVMNHDGTVLTTINKTFTTSGTDITAETIANDLKIEIDKQKDSTDWITSVVTAGGVTTLSIINDNSGDNKNIQLKDVTGNLFSPTGTPDDIVANNTAKKFRYTDGGSVESGWSTGNTAQSAVDQLAINFGTTDILDGDLTINGVTVHLNAAGDPITDLVDLQTAIAYTFPDVSITANATGEITSASTPLTYSIGNSNGSDATLTSVTTVQTFDSGRGDTFYFKTTEDLREGMQELLRNYQALDSTAYSRPGVSDTLGNDEYNALSTNPGATVVVTEDGKFSVTNLGVDTGEGLNQSVNITISSIKDSSTAENVYFTEMMTSMSGALPAGSTSARSTQPVGVPTHSSSIDIYDSLGSKHTLKIDFRKEDSGATTGATWYVRVSVPSPAVINDAAKDAIGLLENTVEGKIYFNDDGSLKNVDAAIRNIKFTGNNGSAPDQSFTINYGTFNKFDGMTSNDNPSSTSGISQDGFPGGDLVGIRIDQSGTLIGSFTNGRSFGLGQIAMAKFANNEGLVSDGGNTFLQSSNSGNPITGTAATGGRGYIQASALEASNVDLSRSLTQLIIIQKGYQANGKTITTSDTILETLIGLKR